MLKIEVHVKYIKEKKEGTYNRLYEINNKLKKKKYILLSWRPH